MKKLNTEEENINLRISEIEMSSSFGGLITFGLILYLLYHMRETISIGPLIVCTVFFVAFALDFVKALINYFKIKKELK